MSILIQYGPAALLFAFLVVHCLADFPLQGDYLARHKQRNQAGSTSEWLIALSAHSLIHGGGVWLVSGSPLLGAVEVVLHWLIDAAKGAGRFGLVTDQLLHVLVKVIFVVVMATVWTQA